MNKYIVSFVLVCLIDVSIAQKKCTYKIDTSKVINNENLPALIKAIEKATFTAYTDKAKIPASIKKELECLVRDGFTMANPNEKWNVGCDRSSDEKLPERQLVTLGISKDICVLQYNTGGIALRRNVLVVKFTKDKIVDLWKAEAQTSKLPEKTFDKAATLKYLKTVQKRPKAFLWF